MGDRKWRILKHKFKYNNNIYYISTESKKDTVSVTIEGNKIELDFTRINDNVFVLNDNNEQTKAYVVRVGDKLFLNLFGRHYVIDDVSKDEDQDYSGDQGDSADTACAPMPGSVLKVMVKKGDKVKFDQPLVIIEAMKMENEVRAPRDGIIEKIVVEEGMQVGSGDNLILFESS